MDTVMELGMPFVMLWPAAYTLMAVLVAILPGKQLEAITMLFIVYPTIVFILIALVVIAIVGALLAIESIKEMVKDFKDIMEEE